MKLEMMWDESKGRGVYTVEAITKGEYVVEYEVYKRYKR